MMNWERITVDFLSTNVCAAYKTNPFLPNLLYKLHCSFSLYYSAQQQTVFLPQAGHVRIMNFICVGPRIPSVHTLIGLHCVSYVDLSRCIKLYKYKLECIKNPFLRAKDQIIFLIGRNCRQRNDSVQGLSAATPALTI